MSIFSLDEEFSQLTVDGNCAILQDEQSTIIQQKKQEYHIEYQSNNDFAIGVQHKNLMSLNPTALPTTRTTPIIITHQATSSIEPIHTAAHGINIADTKSTTLNVTDTYSENNNSFKRNELKAIPIGSRSRRRSSMLSKLSINTPPNTTRILLMENSIKDNSCYMNENVFEEDDDDNDDDNDDDDHTIADDKIGHKHKHIKRKLTDFQPLRVLGKGAYGKVLLVRDHYNNKLYAMKQLKKAEIILIPDEAEGSQKQKDNIDNEGALQKRLERTFAERSILSSLEHPHIVKLFYSFHDNNKLYLLLQYIPGGELFYHLKNLGKLEEDAAAFYAAEISLALKFLHSKGIVYRDLKPENCLLNERGHLVLTDFGLSKQKTNEDGNNSSVNEEDDVETLHSIIGTPEYAAPEILQGIPYTRLCDWYSLGCIVYDMICGKPPYVGVNHKVILNKILKEKQVKLPFYLSEGMKDLLGALLKKDVNKRWNVDKYWKTIPNNNNNGNSNSGNRKRNRSKKSSPSKTTGFQQHFVFRKINWKNMEDGSLQQSSNGPIVPIINDWSLAENFDEEFTNQRLDSDITAPDTGVAPIGCNNTNNNNTVFKGFSYVASSSYLERYF
ncbi:putative protein kinase YPK3 SCDLUD_002548 [Saccharomycodes ludwigii]|uniref:putative protein kinase YPK3 n=1 Tax=Saccharomycodes ludwigii TaxID=36035 RepID=UPI001E86C34A|nr:hypothetical protein SCDLUD_002548 [Saccharomycodes ludwigii]KAH3901073.1 hypothetical protein SCDLUD_002548 [Saccharomycodes ludwigii]